MQLIDGWWDVLKKAWSVRIMLIAAALDGIILALPAFTDAAHPYWFLTLSMIANLAAVGARLVKQPELSDDAAKP